MHRLQLAIIMAVWALSAHAEQMRFESFAANWEDGWTREDANGMIRLTAPMSQRAGVTIDVTDQEGSPASALNYARTQLPRLAERHGGMIGVPMEETLPSGAVLYSVVCYNAKRDYFGIIVVNVSAKGRLAQFAFEGFGDPKPHIEPYRKLVREGHWLSEPDRTPEKAPHSDK